MEGADDVIDSWWIPWVGMFMAGVFIGRHSRDPTPIVSDPVGYVFVVLIAIGALLVLTKKWQHQAEKIKEPKS